MLLGHWYLVQPGLRRDPLRELVVWNAVLWPFEVAAFLWPTGMVQVFNGTIDDGYGGLLGWVWVVSRAVDDRAGRRDLARAAGAVLLGGDGRDRPALPRHPHRVRYRPRRARRPRAVTAGVAAGRERVIRGAARRVA